MIFQRNNGVGRHCNHGCLQVKSPSLFCFFEWIEDTVIFALRQKHLIIMNCEIIWSLSMDAMIFNVCQKTFDNELWMQWCSLRHIELLYKLLINQTFDHVFWLQYCSNEDFFINFVLQAPHSHGNQNCQKSRRIHSKVTPLVKTEN